MDQNGNGVYEGRDPNEALAEAVALRPIPAIEKPLGLASVRLPEIQREEQRRIDVELANALAGWNDLARGRERGF